MQHGKRILDLPSTHVCCHYLHHSWLNSDKIVNTLLDIHQAQNIVKLSRPISSIHTLKNLMPEKKMAGKNVYL